MPPSLSYEVRDLNSATRDRHIHGRTRARPQPPAAPALQLQQEPHSGRRCVDTTREKLRHRALHGIRVEQPELAHALWRQLLLENRAQRSFEPLANRRGEAVFWPVEES